MESLYKIDNKIYELIDKGFNETCIDEETGEILEDKAKEELDKLALEREDKLENIALFIKNLDCEIKNLKTEETALSERRKTKENKYEKLKSYVKNSMETFGDLKIETARVLINFKKSKAIQIDDEDLLDVKYKKEKITYTPDKIMLKKLIERGEEIDGVRLVTNNNLQIK